MSNIEKAKIINNFLTVQLNDELEFRLTIDFKVLNDN